jgi:hypothetical protein
MFAADEQPACATARRNFERAMFSQPVPDESYFDQWALPHRRAFRRKIRPFAMGEVPLG